MSSHPCLAIVALVGLALPFVTQNHTVPHAIADDDLGTLLSSRVAPVAQDAYLKATNTEQHDRFGNSVAVSGDTILVGAPWEQSSASGVNGDQADNGLHASGAAYVFVFDGTTWSPQAYLKASNPAFMDLFGITVALSGDTAVIGAINEDSEAIGIDGDQDNDLARNSGAAYVFVRTGTTWNQQAYLKASNTNEDDLFGDAIAISGDTIVIGAWAEDSSSAGVNGDQGDNSAWNAGAAYVFVREGTTWTQQAYLKASNPGGGVPYTSEGDHFGTSVSVCGDTIAIGARNEDSNRTEDSGAAYVFERSGTVWAEAAYLKAPNPDVGDRFGQSVATCEDLVVVGAHLEDSADTGVDGDLLDNTCTDSGAVYAYKKTAGQWQYLSYIKATNTGGGDQFGWSVDLAGSKLVVGAYMEASGATGINGDQSDDSAPHSGAAYLLSRMGTTWVHRAYVKASNTEPSDYFGKDVAVCGDSIVVSSDQEDSSALGVDGDQADNSAPGAGAAYAFGLDVIDAACVWYCGNGLNMDTYSILTPFVLGSTFRASVSVTWPNAGAMVVGYLGQDTFTIWGQEGLVDLATTEVTGLPGGAGNPTIVSWAVPGDPSYAGYRVFTQAAGIGGGIINLTCAFDCTAGY